MYYRLLLALVYIFSVSEIKAQIISGRIIEKETKLPVAFASIIYQNQLQQKGVISDINGKFEIKEKGVSSIAVSCIGYKQKKVALTEVQNFRNVIIELDNFTQELNEVIITPDNNPAIRIIKNVLANKDKNNFQQYDKYAYQCYIKTLIDLKLSNDATALDSLYLNNNQVVKKNAAFISEYVVSSLKNGSWVENKIIAQKTSGFESPTLVQAFTSVFHNSISFYNNYVSLFELPVSNDKSISEYLSPLSDGAISIYNYEIEDTIENETDSVFILNFYPKKGKKFNSLIGKLYISNNGYAIKTIVVEPFEKGLISFRFKQEYELINNKWFPTKLDEEIGWVNQKIKNNINAYPVYLISSNISNINFNPITQSTNKLEKVYVDNILIKNSDSIINSVRPNTLTLREKNTFQVMDSVSKKYKIEYWVNLFPKLANGRTPVNYFDIDLYQLYNYNLFEGARLGIGLYTNEKLSNYFSIGGFSGYGLKDEKYKYGARINVILNKTYDVNLKISYQNNLKEAGVDLIEDYSKLSFSTYLRNYVGFRFDECIQKKAEFSFRTLRFLNVTTSLSLSKNHPTYLYAFKGSLLSDYDADEILVSFKYANGLNIANWNNQQIVNTNGNPVIIVTYKRGINLFNRLSYQYNKIETSIDFTAYNGRIGQSDLKLTAGFVNNSLPYGLLFTGEGCRSTGMPLLINCSFQTMAPYEFLSDKYVNLFYSHNFGSLLFKTKKFKPQFIVVQNSGWGNLSNTGNHNIDFKTKDKIYLESGLVINNIFKINYLNIFYVGFGIGGFYRYGYYSNKHFSDNAALKLNIKLALK